MASAPIFRAEEDVVIREFYPNYEEILRRLPDRSHGAIRRRASKIGASAHRSTSLARWTDEEDRLIRRHYPTYKALYALLPNRTVWAIKRRAADIGVSSGRCGGSDADALPWTAEERAMAARWGAKIPGRSRFALISFRNRNGIKVDRTTRPSAKGRQPLALKPARRRAQKTPLTPKAIVLLAPKPVAWKRQGNEISPRVIAAAARSKHGIELIATVQRAVPLGTWPHLRPLAIESVALTVINGTADPTNLAETMKATVAALVARQFEGSAA